MQFIPPVWAARLCAKLEKGSVYGGTVFHHTVGCPAKRTDFPGRGVMGAGGETSRRYNPGCLGEGIGLERKRCRQDSDRDDCSAGSTLEHILPVIISYQIMMPGRSTKNA